MKKQDITKLNQNDISQLTSARSDLQIKLIDATHSLRIGKLTNTKEPSAIRHQIAIINTIIRNKELEPTKAQKQDK